MFLYLNNFWEILFLLQDLIDLCSEWHVVGEVLVVVVVEGAHVLGVRDQPVDRREVLALSQLFVQAPEDL